MLVTMETNKVSLRGGFIGALCILYTNSTFPKALISLDSFQMMVSMATTLDQCPNYGFMPVASWEGVLAQKEAHKVLIRSGVIGNT